MFHENWSVKLVRDAARHLTSKSKGGESFVPCFKKKSKADAIYLNLQHLV